MWKIHQNAQSLPLFPDPSSIGSEHLISLPYASLSALIVPEIKENYDIKINQMNQSCKPLLGHIIMFTADIIRPRSLVHCCIATHLIEMDMTDRTYGMWCQKNTHCFSRNIFFGIWTLYWVKILSGEYPSDSLRLNNGWWSIFDNVLCGFFRLVVQVHNVVDFLCIRKRTILLYINWKLFQQK